MQKKLLTNYRPIKDYFKSIVSETLGELTYADHLLFIFTLLRLFSLYGLSHWLNFFALFIFSCKYSKDLSFYERFYISASIEHFSRWMESERLLFTGYFTFLEDEKDVADLILVCVNTLCYFEINVYREISKCASILKRNKKLFMRLIRYLGACAGFQLAFFRAIEVNTRRKVFHFFAFLVFFRRNELVECSSHLLLFALFMAQGNRHAVKLYQKLRSKRDRGRRPFSHILLLGSLVHVSKAFTSEVNYHAVLVSMCFLDSFSSIVGRFFGAEEKSLYGLLGGFCAANIVYFIIYRNLAMWKYFLLMSLVEYLTQSNDNITLPFTSFYLLKE